jgi:hypothetical protein
LNDFSYHRLIEAVYIIIKHIAQDRVNVLCIENRTVLSVIVTKSIHHSYKKKTIVWIVKRFGREEKGLVYTTVLGVDARVTRRGKRASKYCFFLLFYSVGIITIDKLEGVSSLPSFLPLLNPSYDRHHLDEVLLEILHDVINGN